MSQTDFDKEQQERKKLEEIEANEGEDIPIHEEPKTNPEEPKTNPEEPKTNPEEPKANPEEPKANPEEPKANPEEPKTIPEQDQPEDRIAQINAQIEERKKMLQEKEELLFNHEATQEALKSAQQKHLASVKEMSDLDKRVSQIKPEYELALQNSHLREVARTLTTEMEENEKTLAEMEEKAHQLEKQLSDASKQYKEETARMAEFLKAAGGNVKSLRQAVQKKLKATSAVDADGTQAFDTLQEVSSAVMARGKQMSTLKKILRDQKCMIEINHWRKEIVESTGKEKQNKLLQQKDEQIRVAVFQFQDERAVLHSKIEEMQRISKEQLQTLQAGETQRKPEPRGFGTKSTVSTREEDDQLTLIDEIEKLKDENARLKGDVTMYVDDIRKATKAKTELLKEDKLLQLRVKAEREHQAAELAKIDNDIEGAKLLKARSQKESDKIAEMVKVLTKQVQKIHEANCNTETRTKPLPVE